jgi:hypothetical protein
MDKYFAAEESIKKVEYLMSKSQSWFKSLQMNDYLDKIQRSIAAYQGTYYNSSHSVGYGGEQGELVNLAVNHYRNLAQHMLNMVTSTRPSFQARAVNTDRRSLVQAKLANNLLDYYMREKRLEKHLKKSVEYAIVLSAGYIKMEWNATRGEIYDYVEPDESSIAGFDEEGKPIDAEGKVLEPFPIYEGDVEFNVLSPLDVVFDSTKENPELHDWVLCRTFINKFDLAKKYPEMEEKIMAIPTKDTQGQGRRTTVTPYDETVDVPVYEFFHKRTESVPEGNYTLFLDSECILVDTIMPYRNLPVYRIAPSDVLGAPYGYTTMFDLLPMQDAVNSLYSTIMTNQNAFGVQSILNPRGNDVRVNQLQGGLNFIEYNQQVGKPEALNLTSTPAEIFNFLQKLETTMETISGVNSVARGNPESSLRSGNALALIQSQALQFISGLQQSYIQLLEDVGTGLVKLLQDFAKVPRIVAIAGISQTTKMQEFKGEDINSISRVVVDVGNALANTAAGRSQIAENLLQMGLIKSPEKYLAVLSTGNLDVLMEGELNELDTVKSENEALLKGDPVIAIMTDDHALHIKEHRGVIADPVLRQDAELVKRTLDHIQEHINQLRTVDPGLLAITQQQPLPPMQAPMPPQDPNAPQIPQGGMPNPAAMPEANSVATMDGTTPVPAPATPPPPFENAPQTPQAAMAKQLGA